MASWKKVIVSGSSAELSSLSLDTALTVANGGTGVSTVATNGILYGNGTSALQVASAAANSVLITNGSNVPSLSTTLPSAVQGNITSVGTIGSGTWQGTAIADTYVANDLTIDGGTVDNTVIGGSTPAAGTFTSGSFKGIALTNNGTLSGIGSNIIFTGANSSLTGSFSGSFSGDGSGLSGVTANFPTTLKSSPLAATDLFFYNDNNGSNPSKKLTLGTLATDIAGSGLTVVGSKNLHVDSGSLATYFRQDAYSNVSGDITIASNGTAAIGSGVIVNADINASAAIAVSKLAASTISGVTLGNNLANLVDGNGIADFTYNGSAGATVTVQADGSTLSVGASGVKVADAGITETQLNTSVAGTGLSGGAGTALSVDYGTSAGTAAQGNVSVTFSGTSNEIELSTNTFSTIGGGGSVTIGLPNDVTIGNNLTVTNDLSVTGNAVFNSDITVRGTASFENTQNLEVADRFILLASGSTSAGDGGIVIQQSAGKIGAVFAYDGASTSRWGIATGFHASASAYTPEAFMGVIFEGTTAAATSAGYDEKGHIVVNGEDIYIYS